MSVAAVTPSEIKAGPVNLWTASLAGGVYVLAAIAVVFYGVPQLWQIGVGSWLVPALGNFVNVAGRLTAQVAAVVLLTLFGQSLAGPNPPRGLRGGIFLAISTIFATFFLLRGLLTAVERLSTKFEFGQFLGLIFVGFCLFLLYKFLKSDRKTRWSIALEDAGWFDPKPFKRNQGVRVRRMTLLGILLLFGSGIYTLVHNNIVGEKNWTVSLPFSNISITLLPDLQFTMPLLLGGLASWFAWRIVNFPTFADFLIATEAEINKVSWTPRARLIQDTIVVLITLFIITLFLFIVDIFWGFFLSRSFIGVLPSSEETKKNKSQQVISSEW